MLINIAFHDPITFYSQENLRDILDLNQKREDRFVHLDTPQHSILSTQQQAFSKCLLTLSKLTFEPGFPISDLVFYISCPSGFTFFIVKLRDYHRPRQVIFNSEEQVKCLEHRRNSLNTYIHACIKTEKQILPFCLLVPGLVQHLEAHGFRVFICIPWTSCGLPYGQHI